MKGLWGVLKSIVEMLFGKYCKVHKQSYRSAFCPQCNRVRWYEMETEDDRRYHAQSEAMEGSWPLAARRSR